MKKIFLSILFINTILTSIGYSQTSKKIVLDNKVSFSLPYEWKTITDEPIEELGWYFSAENVLEGATGLITITWINSVAETDKTILSMHENMKADNIYKEGGIEFTGLEPTTFAGTDATTSRYITFVKNTRIEGTILCFNCEEKTVTIIFQSGYSDLDKNRKTLELIKSTFVCK
jgi:hypothetical protein